LILDPTDFGQEFQFVVRLTSPGLETEIVARANFVGHERHHNIVNNWMGVPVAAEGVITFNASLNDDHVARHELTVYPADPTARLDGTLLLATQAPTVGATDAAIARG
jgi:hypothetical protein